MWSEIAPDRCHNIAVEGYNVVAYQFGDGDETVLCLNGGDFEGQPFILLGWQRFVVGTFILLAAAFFVVRQRRK